MQSALSRLMSALNPAEANSPESPSFISSAQPKRGRRVPKVGIFIRRVSDPLE